MKITWTNKKKHDAAARDKIIQTDVIIDIGPGIRPQNYLRPRIHICIEPFLPYLEQLKRNINDDPTYVLLNCDWETGYETLSSKIS